MLFLHTVRSGAALETRESTHHRRRGFDALDLVLGSQGAGTWRVSTDIHLFGRGRGRIAVKLEFHPVTPERLPDLACFSEQHGKFRYCSCMRWRLTSAEFRNSTKESRVAQLAGLVSGATPVGVLAYLNAHPVGWCSIAPRETYRGLERYRGLPRVDDTPVWSVVCFFVDSQVRKQRVSEGLLRAAVEYARSEGAAIVEGYPVEPGSGLYTYMGSPGAFRRVGFQDVTPGDHKRRVMRYFVAP